MIRHIALFRWNPEVSGEDVDSIMAALGSFAEAIPMIRKYEYGPNVGVEANYNFGITAEFDSMEAFEAYRDDEAHQRLIQDHFSGRVAERAAIQITI